MKKGNFTGGRTRRSVSVVFQKAKLLPFLEVFSNGRCFKVSLFLEIS